jgi:hypothetical protein
MIDGGFYINSSCYLGCRIQVLGSGTCRNRDLDIFLRVVGRIFAGSSIMNKDARYA